MKFIIITCMIAVAMAEINSLLKESNDNFSAKMLDEVVKSKPDTSVILSGFSILPPLAQLTLASTGASHDELLKTIGLPNDDVTKEVFKSVNDQLRAVKGVDLKMASRVYVANNAEINPKFAALSRDVFNSDVKNVDFAGNAAGAAKEINTWVEEQTNNKIKDLVDPNSIEASTRAILVNAIYFKGNWKSMFDKSKTKDGDFHVTANKIVKVPMMHQTATFRYGESTELDAKLLELAYEGEESSFLVVLPNKVDGLKQLQEKLKEPAVLNKAVEKMITTKVVVSLPKFKIETTTNLKEILQKLQVKKVFSPGEANLVNLLNKETDLYISNAIQKAFIEVSEEGAEAAAANEFHGLGSALITEPKTLKADRPFYFQIKNPGLPLFEGVLLQP